jgi:probable F420-dependent oxidoreductase
MQFGVALPNFGRLGTRQALVEIARAAEDLGYASVWTTDHVMMSRGQDEPYGSILEAFVALTWAAAVTQRVQLGTSVIVVPLRQPVLIAKQAATLDYLSDGRLILGVGAGWNQREFGFLGMPFDNRGRRFNEAIRAMRELWTSPDPRYEGEFVQFGDVLFGPKPAQRGGPPIWLGGSTPAALRRAARLCDGWQPVGATPDQVASGLRTIREQAGERRVVGSVRLRAGIGRTLPEQRGANGQVHASLSGSADDILRQIEAYASAGVEHMLIGFPTQDLSEFLDQLRLFADQVMQARAPA